MRSCSISLACGYCLLVCLARVGAAEPALDLGRAVVVTPAASPGPEKKAVAMLVEEVEKRTRIRWHCRADWPKDDVPVIAVGQAGELRNLARVGGRSFPEPDAKPRPEGYQLRVDATGSSPAVWVAGNDARGVLFGVGRLLRALDMTRDRVTLAAAFQAATAPHYGLRGHQLGYRPKTNSYDGWDLRQWEQYLRDLVVFGANAVELIPPRSDDDADSPHFPLPPLEMMAGMSQLCADYGLAVWVWYPAMDKDYADPKTVASALGEWGEVFRNLPRVDAVFVPGGDPGHTPPRVLFAFLEKQAGVLRRHHPAATLWVSPQSFTRAWMDEFLALLRDEPAWLAGVVHGPQTRLSMEAFRAAVPKKYPVRNYPDITHSRSCQFPVPDWDVAFALTEAREVINPRPRGMAHIFRTLQKHADGFLTYSEGCNDDVNKAVWSALGWDPDADVVGVLRDYGRYFLGPGYADSFAQGLLALERNWEGPVLTNASINATLGQFQALEKAAGPRERLNWRFQQALFRAYYDAYVRSRLLHETQLEDEAMGRLRQARRLGALRAVAGAERILDLALTRPAAEDVRARVFELGEALFQSVHMQLSVRRYQGMAGRGTNLDTIDRPLNNGPWLRERFAEVRRAGSEAERLERIDEIVNWTNPGPGGFYDDLGNPSCQPHLVRGPGFSADPAFLASPLTHFEDRPTGRLSWCDQALSLYDDPLTLRYTGLDPAARYIVRAVYGGGPIRLVADAKTEVHPLLNKPYERVEFDLPPRATGGGTLTLRWYGAEGRGGPGRGCQVAEVWLIKKQGK